MHVYYTLRSRVLAGVNSHAVGGFFSFGQVPGIILVTVSQRSRITSFMADVTKEGSAFDEWTFRVSIRGLQSLYISTHETSHEANVSFGPMHVTPAQGVRGACFNLKPQTP